MELRKQFLPSPKGNGFHCLDYNEDDVYEKVGHLSPHDYIKVMTAFNNVKQTDVQVLESLKECY